ncbi:MAG: glycosyltransferase, partial [Deltaproteobacteria bacterium]|nr:glycosyltransferase [Deltaproteobacteria bacterium]
MNACLFLILRADIGGGSEHLWHLLKNLPPETRARVACPRDYPYYERYRECVGAENILILPHRRFCLSALWRLRSFCRERGVVVLHSHGKGAGLYSRLLALLTGLPCVHTFHGVHMREYGSLKKHLYRWCERFLSLWTRAAIAVSEGERAQILAEGLMPAAKLRLVVNGVGIPATAAGEPAGPPFRVISMSRFTYQKHSEFLVEIAQALRQRGRLGDFRFILVGDGPGRSGLMADAEARGLAGSLECPGASLEPHTFFAGAFCYLSTSRWEGMSLGVLEALAHGLPAVVTDVVGNRDAVSDNETGFLYPEGDADAAASALCRLADDPDLRRTLGARAREHARQRHDARKMAADTLALLRDAAGNTLSPGTSSQTGMERIIAKMCRQYVSPADRALLDTVFAAEPTQAMLDECLRVCDIEEIGAHKSLMFSYLMREHPELRFSEYAAPRLRGLISYFRFANVDTLRHFSRIGKALNAAGIPMLIFKGAAMKILRPDLSRPMGDVDILIPPERMNEAVSLCRKLGYHDARDGALHAVCIRAADGKDAVDIHQAVFKREDTSGPIADTFHKE